MGFHEDNISYVRRELARQRAQLWIARDQVQRSQQLVAQSRALLAQLTTSKNARHMPPTRSAFVSPSTPPN